MDTTPTHLDLDKLEALEKTATPAPWGFDAKNRFILDAEDGAANRHRK